VVLGVVSQHEAIIDPELMKKSRVVIAIVIIGFVIHQYLGLESATIAITGAALLMLISREDPEEALITVEWATLFFFVGLFILVGGLEKVGIIVGCLSGWKWYDYRGLSQCYRIRHSCPRRSSHDFSPLYENCLPAYVSIYSNLNRLPAYFLCIGYYILRW
jgi:hypothetical protein